MNVPQPMWCNRCGERFNRSSSAIAHICVPNYTGFNPGDTVRVGPAVGQVLRVDRASAEVYFRASFRTRWYAAGDLERVP